MRQARLTGLEKAGRAFYIERPFPLLGHLLFGIIDRGLNIIQVRVTSLCGLACPFCSVDAGLATRRVAEFVVRDPEWVGEWVGRVVADKGEQTDVIFDAAGDPITNPLLPEFIREVRRVKLVRWVILETRLFGANEEFLERLWEAGLDRINVSIDTLNPEKAAWLAGNSAYEVGRVKSLVEFAFHRLGIDVHVAPLWLPGINDKDLEEVIAWALENGFGRRAPPLGIQKYVAHPHGRKLSSVKEPSWREWREFLERLEEKFGVKLILSMEDYGLKKTRQIEPPARRGETIKAIVAGEGPYRGEYLAVTKDYSWALTIVSKREPLRPGDAELVRIVRDRDGILLGVPA